MLLLRRGTVTHFLPTSLRRTLATTSTLPPPIHTLVKALSLERLEENLFRGQSYDPGWGRVFGGQVLGQALSAAQATVSDPLRSAHSLHSYFLRPGDPHAPIVYDVDRIRDGKSFSARRVKAIQNGNPIFFLTASFHATEDDALEHQELQQPDLTNVPLPEDCLPLWDMFDSFLQNVPKEMHTKFKSTFGPTSPIQIRPVSMQNPLDPQIKQPRQDLWIKSNGALPLLEDSTADPSSLHRTLLSFASDYGLLETALNPHGISLWELKQKVNVATIDHSMWFHHPFQFDRWWLHRVQSPIASSSRGLCFGEIIQDGVLVASTAQQGLMRKMGTS